MDVHTPQIPCPAGCPTALPASPSSSISVAALSLSPSSKLAPPTKKKREKKVGTEHLVLDLSCRKRDGQYFIVTDRWQKFTETVINEATIADLERHCAEFLIHAADVEGKMGGPDLELIELLAQYTTIPVTYAGGVASLQDLDNIDVAGQGRIHVTVGSALDIFGGKLSYNDVVFRCKRG